MRFNLGTNQGLKRELRATVKNRLQKLTLEEYQALNEQIRTEFFKLEVVQKATKIMLYHSIGYEVETITIIQKLLVANKEVYLPACVANFELEARLVKDLDLLVTGKMKIKEPEYAAPTIDPQDLDLIVVPGVAFDLNRNRLGHGAGYYDRFLSQARNVFKLGLAYQLQIFPSIPTDEHDIPMDAILTSSGLI